MTLQSSITFQPFSATDPQPDWDSFTKQSVQTIWLLRRDNINHGASARGWQIAIQTPDRRMLTIHPEAPADTSIVDIVCKPICSVRDSVDGKDFATLLEATFRIGRAVPHGTEVGDLLETIHVSGIKNYHIVDGRGLRFWLALALYQLRPHIKEPRSFDFLPDIGLHQMRDVPGPERKITRQRILRGRPVPHKFSKPGYASWIECRDRSIEIATKQDFSG